MGEIRSEEQIRIECTNETFSSRTWRSFKWMLFAYFLLLEVMTQYHHNIDLTMFLAYCFLAIIFMLDYLRRQQWTRFSLLELIANKQTLHLKFKDKDLLLEENYEWNEIEITRASAFLRNPGTILIIKKLHETILKLHAGTNKELDDTKLKLLIEDLKRIQSENLEIVNPKSFTIRLQAHQRYASS